MYDIPDKKQINPMTNSKQIYSTRNAIPGSNLFGFRTMEQVKDFVKVQQRRKGFIFNVGVGNNTFAFNLSGDAEALLGLIIYDNSADPNNAFSFIINNDTIIEDVPQCFLCRIFGDPLALQISPFRDEFIPVPRPLSGNDSMQIQYNAETAGTLFVEFVDI